MSKRKPMQLSRFKLDQNRSRQFSRSSHSSRSLAWGLLLCLGLLLAIELPILPLSAIPAPIQVTAPVLFLSARQSDAQSNVQSETQSPVLILIQQGIDFYETEQFTQAIDRWQQALVQLAQMSSLQLNDRLQRVLVWSNLSSAYQKLGQWQAAEQAIANSLELLQSLATATPTATQSAIQAKVWNTQGQLHWAKGHFEAALQAWQQATANYEAARDRQGMIISTINQANAWQMLGFSAQAQQHLERIQQQLQHQPDRFLQIMGWRSLGNAQRRLGQTSVARQTLQTSLAALNQLETEHALTASQLALRSILFLDLGNSDRTLAERALAVGKIHAAEQAIGTALQFYQQAATTAAQPRVKLQALLNRLGLQIEQHQNEAAIALIPEIQATFSDLSPSRFAWYAQLNFADRLLQLHLQPEKSSLSMVALPSLAKIAQQLARVIQQARAAQDSATESYALGQLGKLYEQTHQWQLAQQVTQQALLKAEALQAPEIRYRWEWQLGRLQQQQGQSTAAIAAYAAAVQSLQSVRHDLLRSSSEIQFSFRDTVEPIYRELVTLLLSQRSSGAASPSQTTLKQTIELVDTLQLTELENFLGCELTPSVKLNTFQGDPTAAKLYPMLLPDRLAVVLELPDPEQPLHYHEVRLSSAAITTQLQQLRQDLSTADRTPEALQGLQIVDRWLIAPFQSVLQQNPQITTLVFVLDGPLRNIPMAALYDGETYLVQHYAIALSPRLELFQPTPRPETFKFFLAGVGEPQTINQQQFPKIEYLDVELSQISQITGARTALLNRQFTKASLEQQLRDTDYSAIHIKTHGTFSSEPEETFIVAYQEVITGQDLGYLIHTDRLGQTGSIELLVLSACSTAEGDNRAVLGLAGTAIQAGAKTVVSTLWEAQDRENTQLMRQFYQSLSDPQMTRAEALRQAQLALLNSGYITPHIWAPYVLVGNWL